MLRRRLEELLLHMKPMGVWSNIENDVILGKADS